MAPNRKKGCFAFVLVFVCIYLEGSVLVNGKVYPSIHWSYQNPRFKEGTFRLNVLLNSKINIICPHNAISLAETDDSQPSYGRYENFWIVDNSSYHSCNVNTSIKSNEILFRCNDPALLLYETLVFKSFHADKDLEFAQGKTYYFISTSTGLKNSLDSTSKGHCETENMKMEIYICKGSQDVLCSETKPTTPVIPALDSVIVKTTATTAATKRTVQGTSTSPVPSTQETTPQVLGGPDVGELKQETEKSSLFPALWIILVVFLGALLAVSVGLNYYFCRKNNRHKKAKYNREDSCKPPLMASV